MSSVCFQDLSQRKKLEAVALAIVRQFGVNFRIMSCIAVSRSLVKIKLQKETPFLSNEASFVHLEAQMKCYLKHKHTKCS